MKLVIKHGIRFLRGCKLDHAKRKALEENKERLFAPVYERLDRIAHESLADSFQEEKELGFVLFAQWAIVPNE